MARNQCNQVVKSSVHLDKVIELLFQQFRLAQTSQQYCQGVNAMFQSLQASRVRRARTKAERVRMVINKLDIHFDYLFDLLEITNTQVNKFTKIYSYHPFLQQSSLPSQTRQEQLQSRDRQFYRKVGNFDVTIFLFRVEDQELFHQKRMIEKKSIFKFEDYVEPKQQHQTAYHPTNPFFKSLTQFKLDRIFPKNINVKLSYETKENLEGLDAQHIGKSSPHFKLLSSGENRFYHQYVNLREQQHRANIKKGKIAHIFNIKSINLIDKMKPDRQKIDLDKSKPKQKYTKQMKRNATEKGEKDSYKGLNLILVDKKSHSPEVQHRKMQVQKKNSVTHIQRGVQNKSMILQKNGDNFETKLWEYCQYLKEQCQLHGLTMKEIEHYPKNSIVFYVGRGNNGHLIKQLLKKRWWWNITDDKTKRLPNFMWTQLKQKSYYAKKQTRSLSTNSQNVLRRSQSQGKNRQVTRQGSSNAMDNLNEISELQIHNHFENNEFLGNKKALYYNMKAYYEKQGKNVFDYLPVTFHVKRYQDQAWQEFTNYYLEDTKQHEGEKRLWIVKPGQNSNRGNGITIHSDYQSISKLVQTEIAGTNNLKKTFIIQKYIDKPFLYNKRKFDIRCYMLLVRLNGKTKGYWYNEGYIRTSCYEYQIQDTGNEFIHLTNDAIQVNCDKYGKYEDGNKLSYHNFQKYLDHSQKGSYRFVEDICPQLKKIAMDSIEATCHLLGDCNGLPTFQIFGLDYMIDEKFRPWLIEINTNPCLETSSATLERVIPRMVDNAFKLSLDLLFPPPQNWLNSKKHQVPSRVSNNPFELVFDESKISGGVMSSDIIMQMGEIEEDNQIYQQKGQKEQIQGGKEDND